MKGTKNRKQQGEIKNVLKYEMFLRVVESEFKV